MIRYITIILFFMVALISSVQTFTSFEVSPPGEGGGGQQSRKEFLL